MMVMFKWSFRDLEIIKSPPSFLNTKFIKLSLIIVIATVIFLTNLKYFHSQKYINSFNSYSPQAKQAEKSCTPKSNIVFLKTHKCASSAIQNIFMRYGSINRKIFVLPESENYLGHPKPFQSSMVPNPNVFGHEYNILTHHTRFNYTSIKSLMPNNTKFITILRNPVDQFESAFNYFYFDDYFSFTLEQLDDPHFQFPKKIIEERWSGKIGKNQMMFDLGLEKNEMNNREIVTNYIKRLDQQFDLVMIADRMSESLILLKHLLCWQTEDVVVFRLNARDQIDKSNLTDISRSKIKALNWADHLLYRYFINKFNSRIRTFGIDKMRREVEELNNKIGEYSRECSNNSTYLRVDAEEQEEQDYELWYKDMCYMMSADELDFTDLIRERQKNNYPGSVLPKKMQKSTRFEFKEKRLLFHG